MGQFDLHANLIEKYLKKSSAEFSRYDIISYITDNHIEMLNFRYAAQDGRLKTLCFYIHSREYLELILTHGERVDGSSIFSFIEAGSSDLYVMPRYKTAFVNPFTEIPTVDILCSFYTNEGKPLESAPEYILEKSHLYYKNTTGMTFKAMGELEFYIIAPKETEFEPTNQKGYHESEPFIKWNAFRNHAIQMISQCGGKVKYGHSEVGAFSDENYSYEQHEIEFLPVPVEDTADQILIAKWVIRNLAYQYGINVSFAPKITIGKAGSGMHIHMLSEKDGHNVMIDHGKLSDVAKKMIAGILSNADALTAFGNTCPLSYLRLVPHQEAPTNICWGDRNRSVLIRVPLGWTAEVEMIKLANPAIEHTNLSKPEKQTVELRSPDGTADVYLLLAAIVLSAAEGFTMPNALEFAEKTYVNINIHKEGFSENAKELGHLPASCFESAECLSRKRQFFEANNIFPSGTIDNIIEVLKKYEDQNLREQIQNDRTALEELVKKFIHFK
jgi:glutamine synthetase